ncbi:MAG TPA: tetratricopeptide repeat protein [Candidatus Cybelea sp.]|nr:tetratricopeptide repeat protein [Candidatus Cybelea sp.]
MPRRYAFFRVVLVTVVAALGVVLGAVQLASDALDSSAAAPRTLPRRVPVAFGLSVYRALDRIAPAAYVETSLAREAIARGDADAAQRYAVKLPASPVRDELLARVALARGQDLLASEYFLAAPDPKAVSDRARALALHDPASGYALERLLEIRLERAGTHPDAVAEAYWQMGRLANRTAWREVSGSALQRKWLAIALRDFYAAVALAPLSERYLVEAANQADLLGDRARAQSLFARAVDIDPRSADAIAGLGVIAWESGDRRAATDYLTRARTVDPNALMVRALERDLR